MAGDYPEVQIAVLLFNINILIVGFIFAYQMFYISRSVHLCDPETDRDFLRQHFLRAMLIPGVAFIGMIRSSVMPSGSLLVYLIIPAALYFLLRSGF